MLALCPLSDGKVLLVLQSQSLHLLSQHGTMINPHWVNVADVQYQQPNNDIGLL